MGRPHVFRPRLCTFTVTNDWWVAQDVDPSKDHFPGNKGVEPWHEEMRRKFKEHKPKDVACSLKTMTNKKSKKPKEDQIPYWVGQMRCEGAGKSSAPDLEQPSNCTRKYFFIMWNGGDRDKPGPDIEVIVEYEGEHHHSASTPVGGICSGKDREDVAMRLRQGKTPKQVQLELLGEAHSKHPHDLDQGNFDRVYSLSAIQQISSQVNREEDNANDVYQDLRLEALKQDDAVYLMSERPFLFAWITASMARLLLQKEISIVGYIDCTGSLVAKVPWKDKVVYNYTLVVKANNKPPVPVAELMSNSHTEIKITYWLRESIERWAEALASRALPFKLLVSDMSWAITLSVMQAFSKMTLYQYLDACMAVLNGERLLQFIVIVWCYSHFIRAISMKVKLWVPVKGAKKFSPVRCFVRMVMATIARTNTLHAAVEIFKHFIRVVFSPKTTQEVVEVLEWFAARFGVRPSTNEDDAEASLLEEVTTKEAEDIPKQDRAYYTEMNYRSSPFYGAFLAVADFPLKKSTDLTEEEKKLKDNPFYLPEVVDYLLRYYLPYYPLWSLSIQSMLVTTNTGNPLTNSAVELRFRLVKKETVQNAKYLKAARFFRKSVKDTENRILEYEYEINFPRKRKINDLKQLPHEQVEDVFSKKPATEKWKKRMKSDTVGGLHSAAAAAKYGSEKLNKHIENMRKHVPTSEDNVDDDFSVSPEQEGFTLVSFPPFTPLAASQTGTRHFFLKAVKSVLDDQLVDGDDMFKQITSETNIDQLLNFSADNSQPMQMSAQPVETPAGVVVIPLDDMFKQINSKTNIDQLLNFSADNSQPMQMSAQPVETPAGVVATPLDDMFKQINSKINIDQLLNFSADNSPPMQMSAQPVETPAGVVATPLAQPFLYKISQDTEELTPSNDQTPVPEPDPCDGDASPENEDEKITLSWHKSVQFPSSILKAYYIGKKKVFKKDIESLLPGVEVFDTVIDCFADRLLDQSQHDVRIYSAGSHVLESMEMGTDISDRTLLLQTLDLIIIPAHSSRSHWVLYIIHPKKKEIFLLDSLERDSTQLSEAQQKSLKAVQFMTDTNQKALHNNSTNWDEWSLHIPQDLWRQENSVDCGVFVCCWLYILLTGNKLPKRLSSIKVNKIRESIASNLLRQATPCKEQPEESCGNELVSKLYLEYDTLKDQGLLPSEHGDLLKIIEKTEVIRNVNYSCPGDSGTITYLSQIIRNMWKATETQCGQLENCILKGKGTNMYHCIVCWEWYHPPCINDFRPKPQSLNETYKCPRHTVPTRTGRMPKQNVKYA